MALKIPESDSRCIDSLDSPAAQCVRPVAQFPQRSNCMNAGTLKSLAGKDPEHRIAPRRQCLASRCGISLLDKALLILIHGHDQVRFADHPSGEISRPVFSNIDAVFPH